MGKTWLVAKHEYWRHVTRRSFLWAALGLPLLFVAIGVGAAWFFSSKEGEPVGVVDQSGMMIQPESYIPLDGDENHFVSFANRDAALAALEKDDVQAFIVVPASYLSSGEIELIHNGDTFDGIYSDLEEYVRTSLLQNSPQTTIETFSDNNLDYEFSSLSADDNRGNPLNALLPFVIGLILAIGIFTSAGYLIQAVVDEKENRTMEILITSLKPSQLIIGKIIGLVGVGWTQIAIWLGLAGIGVAYLISRINNFPEINFPIPILLIAFAWIVPFYLLISSLMAAIGISVTEASEGQQAVGIISILTMFPLWLFGLIINSPDSPLAVGMTLFPFSSMMTVLMRWSQTDIPAWQLILSWLILAASALAGAFLVSKLFRVGMLRYGQKITLKELPAYLRG